MNRGTQTWNPVLFCLGCYLYHPFTDPLSSILKIRAFLFHYCSLRSVLLSDYLLISNLNAIAASSHRALTCANQHVPVLLLEMGESILAGCYS